MGSGAFFLRRNRNWQPRILTSQSTYPRRRQHEAMKTLKQEQASNQQEDLKKPCILSVLTDSFKTHNAEPTPEAYHFVFKTLIQTSQTHQISSVLTHIEQFESFQTPEFIFTDILKFYRRSNNVQAAIHLLYRLPKLRCFPSVHTFNGLLLVLCKDKEGIKLVPQILLKCRFCVRVDESSFAILMKVLCKIRKVGYAIDVLNCMTSCGFMVDSSSLSLILSSLCEQRDLCEFDMVEFFEGLKKLGFCPSMVDFGKLIKFLVKHGKGEDGFDVLNRMKANGMKPDIVCYTMVLGGVLANEDYVNADKLFDEMLVLGLVPDIYTYNVYIKGLCQQNKIDEGIKMKSCMEKLGCKPNSSTYNLLLKALLKIPNATSKVSELLREMRLKGIVFNLQTYRIVIDGILKQGEVTEACRWFEEASEKNFDVKGSIFEELVCELCERGLVYKAVELITKMAHRGDFSPGFKGWTTLLMSRGGSKLRIAESKFIDTVNQSTLLARIG